MKKTNIQKIILVLIPVLFIFSGVHNSKADTYCVRDERTNGVGGGNAWTDYKEWCSTITTDKPSYNPGETISYLVNSTYAEFFCNERWDFQTNNIELVCTYYPPSQVDFQGSNFSMKNSSNATTTSIAGTYLFVAGGSTPLSWLIPNNYATGNYNLFVDDLYIGVNIGTAPSPSCTAGTTTQVESTEYYNNGSSDLSGINYTDNNGNYYSNITVSGGQSICARNGSANGGGFGYLTILGSCGNNSQTFTDTLTSVNYHHLSCNVNSSPASVIATPYANQNNNTPGVTSSYYVGSDYKNGKVSAISCSPSNGFVWDYTNNCGNNINCSHGGATVSYTVTSNATTTSSCPGPQIFTK